MRSKIAAVVGTVLALSGVASVHAANTLYWDSNGGADGVGGDGVWQGAAGNWASNSAGTTTASWANANRDTADFRGTAGSVGISGTVEAGQLSFNAGGYTLSGGAITLGRAAGTGSATLINFANGSGTNTISSPITISDSDNSGAATYTLINNTAGTLTLGSIALTTSGGSASGAKTLTLAASNASGTVIVNGDLTKGLTGTASASLAIGNASSSTNNGTFYLNGSSGIGATSIGGGTIYLGKADSLGTGFTVGSSGSVGYTSILTNGAVAVTGTNFSELKGKSTADNTIGGATADDSSFGMNIKFSGGGSSIHLTAAAGGRVEFGGTNQGAQPFNKIGSGVVAFTATAGNGFSGTVAIDNGTLLAMNTSNTYKTGSGGTSGSATGTGAVTINAGGALGGTGYIGNSNYATATVAAAAASSIITPGDMNKSGVSSIGTLHLYNGLTAADGATFYYDLDGSSIDGLDLGASALALGGTATFNFLSLGTVTTGTPYSLVSGTGTWSGSPTFVFHAPTGYQLDSAYGTGGYVWDTSAHALSVQFAAVPEPTTLAACGLLAFGLLRRSRRNICC